MKSPRFAVSYRLLVAVGLALCCLLPTAAAQQTGGKLTVAIGVPAVTLAPGKSIASIVNSITEGIYEGLVERDASGAVLPGLATSWSLAEDDVTWTLTLRQGVRFHDGTEFSADDVKATFDRILNPDFALPLSSVLKVVSRVEVVDPYTVKIITGSPTPDFLNRLAYGVAVIISSDAVEKYGADIDWTPVGTGPYRLESHVPNESVTLVAFPDYWGGTPLLDRVEFRTVREPGTRVALLEAGEVDIIVDVPATDLPGLKAQADKAVLLAPSTRVMHIGVNTQVAPFDNVLVRQALNYAIDQDGLVNGVLQGVGQPARSIISPVVTGFSPVSEYRYDPDTARRLLAEAGYPNGFSATLWTPEGRYFQDRATAVAVQSMLGDIGVNVDVRVIDWATYLEILRRPVDSSETQLYLLGWESGTGDIGYVLDLIFHTSTWPPAGWNTMFYSNPEVDALIETARVTMDPDTRQALATQIQERIVSDAPWVLLNVTEETAAMSSKVNGLELLPGDVYSLKTVWLDKD